MKKFKGLVVFIALSMLLITGTFYVYQILYTPNVLVEMESRILIIPNDATFEKVQRDLHDGNYVQDLMSFSFLARLLDYDKEIKPGRYLLSPGMSNLEAIRFLQRGIQEPVSITFNNVRLRSELGEKITRNIAITAAEFDSALNLFIETNPYGFNRENVLCMFIPNTYEVYYTITAEGLIERMHTEYETFWNETRRRKADSVGLTPVEVSILASIVQAETIKRDEAPIVAGLYINRLRRDIALQADPTLVFASGDFTLKRVLDVHKEIVSPYNTYMHRGLPPGPINMPEIAYIDAVLNYTPSNYLYMCAREDFSGYHNFAATLSQHMVNARRYQQALSIEQRKARQLQR